MIATFTETVREPERYVAALDRAADAGKPVVVIKVGRAERTQHAITSQTGGLAGSSPGCFPNFCAPIAPSRSRISTR